MNTVTLEAEVRKSKGKEDSKKLRASGLIPAVIYGDKSEGLSVALDPRALRRLYKGPQGRNTIFNLAIKDEGKVEEIGVISVQFERHPISQDITHVDFKRVHGDVPVVITVGVELFGVAPGVKMGGMLVKKKERIKMSCLPNSIMGKVRVDVSALGIGDMITVADLDLGEGIQILSPAKDIIAQVAALRGKTDETATVGAPAKK